MHQYLTLLSKVLTEGINTEDRTGVGTKSLFGYQMRFNLQEGFPLVTTKKIHWKSVVHELLWLLKGDTNVKYLQENGVGIWDEWADKNGELGPVYGAQWRKWAGEPSTGSYADGVQYIDREPIDQISQLLDTLKTNPTSRRMVVSAWNVADLPDMALAPCHCLFQFHTSALTFEERCTLMKAQETPESWKVFQGYHHKIQCEMALDNLRIPTRKLNCQLYQRSADVFLGLPFNVGSPGTELEFAL